MQDRAVDRAGLHDVQGGLLRCRQRADDRQVLQPVGLRRFDRGAGTSCRGTGAGRLGPQRAAADQVALVQPQHRLGVRQRNADHGRQARAAGSQAGQGARPVRDRIEAEHHRAGHHRPAVGIRPATGPRPVQGRRAQPHQRILVRTDQVDHPQSLDFRPSSVCEHREEMQTISNRIRCEILHDRIDVHIDLEELSRWGARVLRASVAGGHEEE
mmetsp:Transcript_9507/g.27115  ORF Transcript_9507/g.27115 Transcript_9507/m.27115 type:complete len:213 (-) Transcript_9507:471-1109(-)